MGKTYRREKEYSRKELEQSNSRVINSVLKKHKNVNNFCDPCDTVDLSLTTVEINMIISALSEIDSKRYDRLAEKLSDILYNICD